MTDERALEIRVGALVLLGIAGVLGLLWLMGELTFSRGVTVGVQFAHTGNVVKGAPVKLGGVTVGQVDAIDIDPTRRDKNGKPMPVQMELGVRDDVARAMHADASVQVATRGPLGEAYLELEVGSPDAPSLQPGQLIHGKEPFRLDQALSRLGRILSSTSAAFEKNPDALPHLIDSLGKLTARLDQALAKNPQALSDMIADLSETAKELHEASAQMRKNFGPGGKGDRLIADAAATAKVLHEQLPGVLTEAKGALHGVSAITGELDATDAKRLKLAIAHYEQAGEHLDALATHADHILSEIDQGKGTIGGLTKDPQIYLDVKALISELKSHPWRLLWKD